MAQFLAATSTSGNRCHVNVENIRYIEQLKDENTCRVHFDGQMHIDISMSASDFVLHATEAFSHSEFES